MKAKLLLIVLSLLVVGTSFGQRKKNILTPDEVNAKIKMETPFLTVTKTAMFDNVVTNTFTAVAGDTVETSINWKLGNLQTVTVVDTVNFTLIDPSYPARLTLILVHDTSSTAFPVYFDPIILWTGGTDYTGTVSSGIDKIEFTYDGTNYLGDFTKDHKD
jgi:hypothetical protein